MLKSLVPLLLLVTVGVSAPQAFAQDAAAREKAWAEIATFFRPPEQFAGELFDVPSPLKFADGRMAATKEEWALRRAEILKLWHLRMGTWPQLLEKPRIEILETVHRDNFTQHKVRVEVASKMGLREEGAQHIWSDGYLLIPDGKGPFPAVFVPFYEPATSAGLNPDLKFHHDYGYQLAKRGYVTLSIGTPGSKTQGKDTRERLTEIGHLYNIQPLSFLAYVAANCHTALVQRPEVDPQRIGIVGLSYGGKWTMFASCLWDKFTCAVWADPGIVFDESNSNINYYEPWYLGYAPHLSDVLSGRKPGKPTKENPATGLYKKLIEEKQQLIDFHALHAPRPMLLSGGTEDKLERWPALNHLVAVNKVLGFSDRAGLTTRATHAPDKVSAEQTYQFFDVFLKHAAKPAIDAGDKSTSIDRDAYKPVQLAMMWPDPNGVYVAAQKGLDLLQKGARNYPEHRECFSCHHQTFPLLTMSLALPAKKPFESKPLQVDRTLQASIGEFTHKSFVAKHEELRKGSGIGGKALTVGYGLWTLDIARWKRDETTDAMVTYLLKTQEEDGHWKFHSFRPPASASLTMTTATAVYGLLAYGPEFEPEKTKLALEKAAQWFIKVGPQEIHEDRIGLVWGLSMLQRNPGTKDLRGLKDSLHSAQNWLLGSQRSDGGWGQKPDMPSDAYATGQAVVMLSQTSEDFKEKFRFAWHTPHAIYQGRRYLINTQEADGSWYVPTRAKPVQVFFDNDDPHGKSQFISIMATGWATTALVAAHVEEHYPLKSPAVEIRRK